MQVNVYYSVEEEQEQVKQQGFLQVVKLPVRVLLLQKIWRSLVKILYQKKYA